MAYHSNNYLVLHSPARRATLRAALMVAAVIGLCATCGARAAVSDPGCRGDESNALLTLLTAPEPSAAAAYLRTPAGQMLDAALRGEIKKVEAQLDAGVDLRSADERPRFAGNHALHHAARTNNVALAKLLLSRGMNINAPGPTGYSALHVASGLGQLDMVQFLLDHGADLDQIDAVAGTPLEIAIIQGRARTVDALIARGALKAPPAKHDDPIEALTRADTLCRSHVSILRSLRRGGVPMQRGESFPAMNLAWKSRELAELLASPEFGIDWSSPSLYRETAAAAPRPAIVQLACSGGGTFVAIDMFRKSPDRETLKRVAVGPWGTPLHCLRDSFDPSVVEDLLEVGFNANARNRWGRTALYYSLAAPDVHKLAKAGADVNARDNDGKTALFYQWEPTRLEALLAEGANPNLASPQGRTPLFDQFHDDIVRLLIAKGADVNAHDENGQTPLMSYFLQRRGPWELLLRAGADVNVRDRYGATAMHYAMEAAGAGSVRVLEKLGLANVAAVDHTGRSPLHYAAAVRDQRSLDAETIAFAVHNGADVNARDAKGDTPLHYAAAAENVYALTALLDAGADTSIQNGKGLRALDVLPAEEPRFATLRKRLAAR